MAGKSQEVGFRDVGDSLFVGSVYVHSLCKNPSGCSPMISAHGARLLRLAVMVGCHCLLCPLHSRTKAEEYAVLLVEGKETKPQLHDAS